MGYVESSLMKGETVLYRGRLHWIIFVGPALLCLVVIGIVWLVAALVRNATSEFAVTNRRVIVKEGLIRRNTLELNLAKVESIGVDQTLLGRMLNYGTIVVVGTGGTREPFASLADPIGFRRAVNEATVDMQQGVPTPRAN
jgi:uncharacterized membrane protein YdbT with pleckstrin-like domain